MIKEFVRTTSKMLLAGGILVLSLAVTGCGGGADASNAASGKTDVLRIGAQPYPLYADVYVAKEKGYPVPGYIADRYGMGQQQQPGGASAQLPPGFRLVN